MKAILKCKHLLFCSLVQSMVEKQGIKDPVLDEMINEMIYCYNAYVQKREELFMISREYETKQKKIKQRLKELKKNPPDEKLISELKLINLKAS